MAAEVFRIEIPIDVKDNTDPGVSSAKGKVSAFDKVVEKTKKRLDDMNKTKWQVAIEAIDKVTSIVGRVGNTVKSVTGKAWKITMGVIDKATAPIRGIFNLLKNPILQAGAVFGISLGLKDTIDTYGQFESTMSKVKAVSGATADQMERLNAKAKEMGATTKFTASEAGEAFTYMSMAGWDAEKMLDGISGIMSLSAADGLDLATTSDIVTDALTAFGLEAKDSAHFADVLAKASSSANTNVSMLGESFKYAAPLAGAMHYSVEDVSLALGLMANASVKGSMAGTSLKTALANMSSPTASMADVMKQYGISLTNANGQMKSLKEVLDTIRQKMGALSETEKTAAASTLFGKEAMSGMLAIINASEQDYQKLAESIANADGAAQQMSETMLDNMQGSFTLLQSAVDGVKISLGQRLSPYLRQFATWITGKMPKVQDAIDNVMDFVDGKVEWLKQTINDFTSGADWENATIWEKIKISWDKIVAEPFSDWWNSKGKAWFADKASSVGEVIGGGISTGLLALLGIDVSSAFSDGASIGGSFIDGFKNGFDTEKITEALKEWASNNKEIVVGIGAVVGFNLITGLASKLNTLTSFFGKGGKSSGTSATGSMMVNSTTTTVQGSVVNVYGAKINGEGGTAGDFAKKYIASKTLTDGGKTAVKYLTSKGSGEVAKNLLGKGSQEVGKGLLTNGATTSGKEILANHIVTLANGTPVATGGAFTTELAHIGTALGSGATTGMGAVAAGAASSAGIIGGILGLGSSVIDLFQGIGKSKKGDKKGAKDEYFSAGSKAGMVGAGAGIGAAIGSVVPVIGTGVGAAVGAGIGGVVALTTGSKAGKALSDSTDKGGWLSNAWGSTKSFFKDDVGGFFKETIPQGWDSLTNKMDTFFTETLPDAWNNMWEDIGNFFTEDVPYAIGYACGQIDTFFTETIPQAWDNMWENLSTFFSDTLPTWASDTWNNHVVPFFTEDIPQFFIDLWDNLVTFFTDTLPTWATDTWDNHIVPFFTEDIPQFFTDLWNSLVTFFTETTPTWASNIWNNHIVPFFTEKIPSFFSSLWDSVTTFVTEQIPTWASNIWSSISGWFSNIGDWFSNVWDSVESSFNAGYDDATEGKGSKSVAKHAYGGIMTSPHLGMVAEAGPEAIIPTSPSKRSRGFDLWKKTGELLGVRPYADGGIVGNISGSSLNNHSDLFSDTSDEQTDMPTKVYPGESSNNNSFDIKVELNPEFIIQGDGMDESKVVSIIKEKIRDMVDDIGDELAERLKLIFDNMPAKGNA